MRPLIYLHVPLLLVFSLPSAGEILRSSELPAEVGSIRVVIREDAHGEPPLLNGQIVVTPSASNRRGEEPRTVKANQQGYYIVGSLLPGEYRVTASAPGYKAKKKAAKVKKYESTPLTLKLPK
jgi:hypothetical protein